MDGLKTVTENWKVIVLPIMTGLLGWLGKPLFTYLQVRMSVQARERYNNKQIEIQKDKQVAEFKARDNQIYEAMFDEIRNEINELRERCDKLESLLEIERNLKYKATEQHIVALTENGLLRDKIEDLEELIIVKDKTISDLRMIVASRD